MAKGYTRPIVHGTLVQLPEEIRVAHYELLAKRKLDLILRSNAVRDKPLSVGDIGNVHVKHDSQKRGAWSQAKPVLHFDVSSQTVTVPGAKGKYIQAATEDVRYAIYDANELATAVQYAIDQCDRAIEDAVDDIPVPSDNNEDGHRSQKDLEQEQAEHDNLQYDDTLKEPDHREGEEEHEPITNGDRNQEQYVDALTYLPTPSVPASTQNMDLRERNPVTYTAHIELQPGSSLTSSE